MMGSHACVQVCGKLLKKPVIGEYDMSMGHKEAYSGVAKGMYFFGARYVLRLNRSINTL